MSFVHQNLIELLVSRTSKLAFVDTLTVLYLDIIICNSNTSRSGSKDRAYNLVTNKGEIDKTMVMVCFGILSNKIRENYINTN